MHQHNDWMEHDGLAKPTLIMPEGSVIIAKRRDGTCIERVSYHSLHWIHEDKDRDIVAYRIQLRNPPPPQEGEIVLSAADVQATREWAKLFLAATDPAGADTLTVDDYKAVIADSKRLTKELDVLLNGEGDGRATQPGLCDIVSQVEHVTRGLGFPLLYAWPTMNHIAKKKLSGLHMEGWKTAGYAIQNGYRFGMVTEGGRVLWWDDSMGELPADESDWVMSGPEALIALEFNTPNHPRHCAVEKISVFGDDHWVHVNSKTSDQAVQVLDAIESMLSIHKELMSEPDMSEAVVTKDFQCKVREWVIDCFGEEIADDKIERNHRFLEEALELVQSLDCTAEEAHKLVDYVYGRPVGDTVQEVGGVMVTLAALCSASRISVDGPAEKELERITNPEVMERIRAKQKAKPSMSPLPGVYPARVEFVADERASILADLAHPKVSLIDVPDPAKEPVQLSTITYEGDTYIAMTDWLKNVGDFPAEATEQSLIRLDFRNNEAAPSEYFRFLQANALVWSRGLDSVNEILSYRLYVKANPLPECPTSRHDSNEPEDGNWVQDLLPVKVRVEDISIFPYQSKPVGAWSRNAEDGLGILHVPSGKVFKSHGERSAYRNRHSAMMQLRDYLLSEIGIGIDSEGGSHD